MDSTGILRTDTAVYVEKGILLVFVPVGIPDDFKIKEIHGDFTTEAVDTFIVLQIGSDSRDVGTVREIVTLIGDQKRKDRRNREGNI